MHTNDTRNFITTQPGFLPKAPAASARRLALRAAMLAAGLCAVITAGMFLASCDYWGEDWYKNGESSTEAATSTQAGGGNAWSYYFYGPYSDTYGEIGWGGSFIFGTGGKSVVVWDYDSPEHAKAGYDMLVTVSSDDEDEEAAAFRSSLSVSGSRITSTRGNPYTSISELVDSTGLGGATASERTIVGNGAYASIGYAIRFKKEDGSSGLAGKWKAEWANGLEENDDHTGYTQGKAKRWCENDFIELKADGSCSYLIKDSSASGAWKQKEQGVGFLIKNLEAGSMNDVDVSFYDDEFTFSCIEVPNGDAFAHGAFLAYSNGYIFFIDSFGSPAFVNKPLP